MVASRSAVTTQKHPTNGRNAPGASWNRISARWTRVLLMLILRTSCEAFASKLEHIALIERYRQRSALHHPIADRARELALMVGLLVSASFGDPAIKQRDPLYGPGPVARHRPCPEASLDRGGMEPHIG